MDFYEVTNKALSSLKKGAFLTVKHEDQVNTMTIAWGMFGHIWNRPIIQVLVRDSRYTKSILDQSDVFTVSFPLDGQLKEALKICGTKSGGDIDKFATCGLKLQEGNVVDVPILTQCNLHMECLVVAKQRMTDVEMLTEDIKGFYPNDNFHTLYYGEVVAVYET